MDIRIEDYELLGKFYLGRSYDLDQKALGDDLILYDSKDLVTHGVVLGMTGSGKTGLCMALLEEAAMDGIPAIVIDPKGDIADLMLTFPDLDAASFRPWINEDDAAKKGLSPDEFAAKTADTWKKGLADWGQSGERIRQFREKVDISIYTPGSNAGLPVSILGSLDVPAFEILDDAEALSERIESTVSSLLSLVGITADPLQSAEHILLSNIFLHSWKEGQGVSLELLIRHIQVPPFDKVGVMSLDTVCPQKTRLDLAMKMNNLLASPGFSTWLEGESLDIKRMLHTPEGKPRITIFSIAHLSDAERMFFVSLLFNQTLGWMRTQTGTTSLRALLYMDEIYGYLPPTAMPPSKKPLMTMLKQARAFGLGVLLATQNPVDLDYKALSNIGTWWLGRLQTERDKARVLDGLEGAAAATNTQFSRSKMELLLSGLGNRVFLMNNVNDDGPCVFSVRWVMSYLTGPLARTQIKALMDPKRAAHAANAVSLMADASTSAALQTVRPRLPKGATDYFVPLGPGISREDFTYVPSVIRIGETRYEDSAKGVSGADRFTYRNEIKQDTGDVDWSRNLPLPPGLALSQLDREPAGGAKFGEIPHSLLDAKFWTQASKDFVDWIYSRRSTTILRSAATGAYSKLGESEGDFRARLQFTSRESRDKRVDDLRTSWDKKIKTQSERVTRTQSTLDVQKAQASTAKMDTALRMGGSVVGALLGKRVSLTSGRTAITGVARSMKESGDVSRAQEQVSYEQAELDKLIAQRDQELAALIASLNPQNESFETVTLTPLKKNCSVVDIGILWIPR